MRLRTDTEGIEYQSLKDKTIPGVDNTLFNSMKQFGRCQQIIPDTLKEYFTEKLENNSTLLIQWQYSYKPGSDNLPGRIPKFEEVQKILAKATECEEHKHSGASWIAEVILPLLHHIFEDFLGRQCAKLYQSFKPPSSGSKMIDICVYASLDQDDEIAAMHKFSSTSPSYSINHTDFEPTQFRPFILSIETKKSEPSDMAKLQIGVWLASQWKFLHWAVKKLRKQRSAKDLTPTTTSEEEEEEISTALSKLPFIPGIIIQGNSWKLVISTYTDGKTKIWSGPVFGSTESLLDIYAIVAGIRELAAWGRDTYLPWFREYILTLE
ncbi:hypothetical protein Trco_008401 [Trichoderma cornu-damae]|uniref:PD-(D/E)XK nuclease-like domain-containing protein n=1 Tax=Trichoderma cornu-damae TaxID=654480 RepID=A0A9P8QE07_9HYPO|nr:hypothetical protein Trco_008401 [Trichoderma cornu-damae]